MDLSFGRGNMGSSSSRTKRMRTSFKHHQLRTMKSYFAINHNPDAKDLKQLSQKTGLPKRVLQVRHLVRSSAWMKTQISSFESLCVCLGLVPKRSRQVEANDDEAGRKINWRRERRRFNRSRHLQSAQSFVWNAPAIAFDGLNANKLQQHAQTTEKAFVLPKFTQPACWSLKCFRMDSKCISLMIENRPNNVVRLLKPK